MIMTLDSSEVWLMSNFSKARDIARLNTPSFENKLF